MALSIAQVVFILSFSALSLLFDRSEFWSYFPLYILMFVAYLFVLKLGQKQIISSLLLAVMLRVMALAMSPQLSDDFYRFHWDGLLVTQGLNPYEMSPREVLNAKKNYEGISNELFEKLNSKDYKSVYPPLSQVVFAIGAMISPGDLFYSMLSMKSILLLFEIGSFFLLYRLLQQKKMETSLLLLYAWNPLVLIEGAVNMHFETMLIFFVLLFMYLLGKQKIGLSGASLGLACLSKLLPFIFIPYIVFRYKLKQSLVLLIALFLVFGLAFFPLLSGEGLAGIGASLLLYFKVFEFNASIYYLLSFLGKMLLGYNPIAVLGPSLALASFLGVIAISYLMRKRDESLVFLLILSLYYLLSTTVHPWYLMPLVALGIFSSSRYWMLWSFVAFVSYAAYQYEPVHESALLLWLQYASLFAFFLWEYINGKFSAHSRPADSA